MSLKAFHILFVAISTLFSLGFAGWCIVRYRATGGQDLLFVGIGSIVGAVALLIYGRWFLRKLKGESYF